MLITSRVQALARFGVPNPLEVARVEQALQFRLKLDERAIEERAREMAALFHVRRIPIPRTFFKLPPHHQGALKLVAQAMTCIDPPFRIQSNAFGDVFEEFMMRTPALAPLRPYYVRFGGPFDFIRSDNNHRTRGFLPGMERVARPPEGGMYPLGMTMRKFRRHVPEGSSRDREKRVIFRFTEEGALEMIPFSQAFARWLLPAASLLDGAAKFLKADSPQVAIYLRAVATAFRTNDYPTADRAWVGMREGAIDLNVNAVEEYMDGLRGWIGQFAGLIQVKDPQSPTEGLLSRLRKAFPKFEENLPVEERFKKPPRQRIAPPVFVEDAVFATGNWNGGEQISVAYNEPNDEVVRKDTGNRIIIMQNMIEARENTPAGKRLKALAFNPRDRRSVTLRGLTLCIFFHEEAHGNGVEFLVDHPKQPATQALGEDGRTHEELKADIVGLHNAQTAFELGLISRDLLHEIYLGYLFKAIHHLRRGTAESHNFGDMVALNYLQDAGAISIDRRTGEISVHFEKMPEVIAGFANELIEIKGLGNRKRLARLYARHGKSIPKGLEVLYRKIAHLPLDIILDFDFAESIA